jgi:hypothetical protein
MSSARLRGYVGLALTGMIFGLEYTHGKLSNDSYFRTQAGVHFLAQNFWFVARGSGVRVSPGAPLIFGSRPETWVRSCEETSNRAGDSGIGVSFPEYQSDISIQCLGPAR